mmetsp:Transcript_95374/g.256100  ORF Transcript_95374/g.256100 Transcript_95374/m.256100 type:complete len:770 (+) Transcript_95374:731-3040(+)
MPWRRVRNLFGHVLTDVLRPVGVLGAVSLCCRRAVRILALLPALRLLLGLSDGLHHLAAAFHRRNRSGHGRIRCTRSRQGSAHRRPHEALRRAAARTPLWRAGGDDAGALQLGGSDLRDLRTSERGVEGLQAQAHGLHGPLGAAGGVRVALGRGSALRRHVQGSITDDANSLHNSQRQNDRRMRDGLRERILAALLAALPGSLGGVGGLVRELRRRLGVAGRLLCGLARLLYQLGVGALLGILVLTGAVAVRLGVGLVLALRVAGFLCPLLVVMILVLALGIRPASLGLGLISVWSMRLLLVTAVRVAASAVPRPLAARHRLALLHDPLEGGIELLELLLVTALVGMAFPRHEPVCALDLGVGGIRRHAEQGVCAVLVEAGDLVNDLALEAHLSQDVLVQSAVHLLQLLLRQFGGLLLGLLRRELQLPLFPAEAPHLSDVAVFAPNLHLCVVSLIDRIHAKVHQGEYEKLEAQHEILYGDADLVGRHVLADATGHLWEESESLDRKHLLAESLLNHGGENENLDCQKFAVRGALLKPDMQPLVALGLRKQKDSAVHREAHGSTLDGQQRGLDFLVQLYPVLVDEHVGCESAPLAVGHHGSPENHGDDADHRTHDGVLQHPEQDPPNQVATRPERHPASISETGTPIHKPRETRDPHVLWHLLLPHELLHHKSEAPQPGEDKINERGEREGLVELTEESDELGEHIQVRDFREAVLGVESVERHERQDNYLHPEQLSPLPAAATVSDNVGERNGNCQISCSLPKLDFIVP